MNKILAAFALAILAPAGEALTQDSLATSAALDYYSPVNVLKFGHFLWQQNDYQRAAVEYQRYLTDDFAPGRDRVLYQLGRCYLKLSQTEPAAKYFYQAARTAPVSVFRDSASVAYAGALLLSKRDAAFLQTADSLNASTPTLSPALQIQLLALRSVSHLQRAQWDPALKILANPLLPEAGETPVASLRQLAERGKTLPQKSRLLAGVMSTLVPGSGKIYARETADGLYSFIIITGASWLAYEGFRDHGISSYKGWLFGSAAAVFHLGNIYGSTIAVRLYNERQQEKLARAVAAQLVAWVNF